VYAAAERAEDPDAALYSRADAVGMLVSSGTGGQLCEAYGAFADELMVGELMITARLRDNLQVARVWIWVDPAHQRCGIGARLSSYADTRAGELGRSVCHATARIGVDRANGNLAFAERMGYALANTEIGRRFGMPADPALVGRLAAGARTAPPRIHDPDGGRAGARRPGGVLHRAEEPAHEGRAYALDHRGVVVACAVAAVRNDQHDHVDQWGTLVDPAHRGHRLGMAVKCAQLRALSDGSPTSASSRRPMPRPTPTWSRSTTRSASRSPRCTATSRSASDR